MKPAAAAPVIAAIRRAAPGVPIHYHTHATSSLMLATCLAASDAGCDIIDFAVESMADQTSQPSLKSSRTAPRRMIRHAIPRSDALAVPADAAS